MYVPRCSVSAPSLEVLFGPFWGKSSACLPALLGPRRGLLGPAGPPPESAERAVRGLQSTSWKGWNTSTDWNSYSEENRG
eukprot:2150298-Pyramimonas_sp.AAC.1